MPLITHLDTTPSEISDVLTNYSETKNTEYTNAKREA
jgi:hypothetical protein